MPMNSVEVCVFSKKPQNMEFSNKKTPVQPSQPPPQTIDTKTTMADGIRKLAFM